MDASLGRALGSYDDLSVGTFVASGSPRLVEALGTTPLAFLVLDRQHAAPSLDRVEAMLRAADLAGLAAVVRLSGHDPGHVGHYLDAGAAGLVVPGVERPAHVRRILERARYDRRRSLALGTRAGGFGARSRADHVARADAVAVVPQVETAAGVAAVDRILAVEGVDALLVGPGDLAFSLGVAPGVDAVETAVDRTLRAAREAGAGAGLWVPSADRLERQRGRASFATWGSDLGVLAGAFDDGL